LFGYSNPVYQSTVLAVMNSFISTMQRMMAVIVSVCFATVAHAHTGDGPHNGWSYGFLHPLSGLDHLLAMIAVGMWSMQLSKHLDKHVVWLMPIIFVTAMGLGGLLGFMTLPLGFAEHGIVLSLLVMGFLIARTVHLPFLVSALLIGIFAVCHGYAHGSEMPEGLMMLDYAAGFMLATALLHVVGIGLALLMYRIKRDQWLRYAGLAVALSGGVMLIGGMG